MYTTDGVESCNLEDAVEVQFQNNVDISLDEARSLACADLLKKFDYCADCTLITGLVVRYYIALPCNQRKYQIPFKLCSKF